MPLRNIIPSVAVACYALATGVRAECPLDHFFFYQEDGILQTDRSLVYRHGDPIEGYYPLSWSPIYQRWSFGEPGFSDTTDPAYGFPPEIQLVGTPNVDYQIWFEILDLSPDFKLQVNDGTWLDEIGDRYNLSAWPEHHVHMKYCAYVPGSPPPDYPFYVTYRLVDALGPYQVSEPFVVVFNVPVPAVNQTEPPYRGTLPKLRDTELRFTFHRPIVVVDDPPVTITDEATQTQDYYTDFFTYDLSPDGRTLILTQVAGTLPEDTWLRVELTDNIEDAAFPGRPAVPFVQFVYPTVILGDMDCDGDVDFNDINPFVLALGGEAGYLAQYPDCNWLNADCNNDSQVDFDDINAFVRLIGTGT